MTIDLEFGLMMTEAVLMLAHPHYFHSQLLLLFLLQFKLNLSLPLLKKIYMQLIAGFLKLLGNSLPKKKVMQDLKEVV